jgi:hypothetical protein
MDVNGFKEQFLRLPNARLRPEEQPLTVSKVTLRALLPNHSEPY